MLRSLRLTLSILVLVYAVIIGGSYTGILTPQFRLFSIVALSVLIMIWLVYRWRHGWRWHATALEGAFLLWALAFAVSLAGNAESWRRIAIALWYMGLYVGLWYALHDALANRGLQRRTLVDALLFTALIVVIFGYVQMVSWAASTLPLMSAGIIPFDLPRPVSTLGNANTLAAFLVAVLPFMIERFFTARGGLGRVVMAIYTALTLILFFLTFSRGAWIGFAVGLVVQLALMLRERDRLSWAYWRGWQARQSLTVRVGAGLATLVALLVAAGLLVYFVRSFSIGGRGLDLRTPIYNAAVRMFEERPLTGYGLFTYGRGLARVWSQPPQQVHSHAHNVPLQIAGELGIVGLLALVATVILIVRATRLNWRAATRTQHYEQAAAVGAALAFGVHHLTDNPSMNPSIALTGLLVLVLATAPYQPVPLVAARRLQPALVGGLWVVLLVSGIASALLYQQYVAAVSYAYTGDYAGAGARLQSSIDADPAQAVYYQQQGYVYGLASADDAALTDDAIAAYERYVAFEPDYVVGWANLAALYWQAGQGAQAVEAMGEAVKRAPDAPLFAFRWGQYAEQSGQVDVARQAYTQALEASPYALFYPDWGQTALQQELAAAATLPPTGQFVRLLETGAVDEAAALWSSNPAATDGTVSSMVLSALLGLAQDDPDRASILLDEAALAAVIPADEEWLQLGRARLALARGDHDRAAQALDAASSLMHSGALDVDWPDGANIPYIQFLTQAIPRQFLPIVGYTSDDPLLLYLLSSTTNT
jgi:O-antigen ligase